MELGTVVLAFNTSKGISISDRPAFSKEWVLGHPGQIDKKLFLDKSFCEFNTIPVKLQTPNNRDRQSSHEHFRKYHYNWSQIILQSQNNKNILTRAQWNTVDDINIRSRNYSYLILMQIPKLYPDIKATILNKYLCKNFFKVLLISQHFTNFKPKWIKVSTQCLRPRNSWR